LREWLTILGDDHSTRRGAGVLFDPGSDFVPESKDIPCNNWLSWLIRDERLHLTIGVRSNDALWGFSGVNAFEWSVLQEMMAFWLDVGIGDATYIATSYHYYTERTKQVEAVVDGFYGLSPYDFQIKTAPFRTPWNEFDAALTEWFKQEEEVRANPDAELRGSTFDPFLASALRLMRLKWGAKRWSKSRLSDELAALPDEDCTAAAYELFGRTDPDLLERPPQPNISRFFNAWRAAKERGKFDLPAAINALHSRKNISYASSWKRRGERISILPNIARKVDRLDAIARGAPDLQGETVLDTVVDLYVYSIKYLLFLYERSDSISLLPDNASRPFSDYDENFNMLVRRTSSSPAKPGIFLQMTEAISSVFDGLTNSAERDTEIEQRVGLSQRLVDLAWQLVSTVASIDSRSAAAFIRAEEAYAHKLGEPANG
jgi:thymidylate synthase